MIIKSKQNNNQIWDHLRFWLRAFVSPLCDYKCEEGGWWPTCINVVSLKFNMHHPIFSAWSESTTKALFIFQLFRFRFKKEFISYAHCNNSHVSVQASLHPNIVLCRMVSFYLRLLVKAVYKNMQKRVQKYLFVSTDSVEEGEGNNCSITDVWRGMDGPKHVLNITYSNQNFCENNQKHLMDGWVFLKSF